MKKACMVVRQEEDRDQQKEEAAGLHECNEESYILSLDALISTNTLQDISRDDGYLIFDRPIRIPESWGMKNVSSRSASIICSAISLFNIGLTHHLLGLGNPTQRSYLALEKASKLYECAMETIPYRSMDRGLYNPRS